MLIKNTTEDAYEKLVNAIVLQAVYDYRMELRKIRKNPGNKEAVGEALRIERFFRSQFYQTITSLDGEYLIDRLRKEASGKK